MSHQPISFDVWGCRGSRSFAPGVSAIGERTSCYSLTSGPEMLVLDAGSGLVVLGQALRSDPRYTHIRTVHLLVTHAHLDHWEGLKDVEWFWQRANGLTVHLYGPAEAITAIRGGYTQPSYVPLEILALGTVARFEYHTVNLGTEWSAGPYRVSTHALHHYSGMGDDKRFLEACGFRVSCPDGPTIAYLCDHEPNDSTASMECTMLHGADLALYDAAYDTVAHQAFGHGSIEHAARIAREHPHTLVLAGHHGPASTDESIRDSYQSFGGGAVNFAIATERDRHAWDHEHKRFVNARTV